MTALEPRREPTPALSPPTLPGLQEKVQPRPGAACPEKQGDKGWGGASGGHTLSCLARAEACQSLTLWVVWCSPFFFCQDPSKSLFASAALKPQYLEGIEEIH